LPTSEDGDAFEIEVIASSVSGSCSFTM